MCHHATLVQLPVVILQKQKAHEQPDNLFEFATSAYHYQLTLTAYDRYLTFFCHVDMYRCSQEMKLLFKNKASKSHSGIHLFINRIKHSGTKLYLQECPFSSSTKEGYYRWPMTAKIKPVKDISLESLIFFKLTQSKSKWNGE